MKSGGGVIHGLTHGETPLGKAPNPVVGGDKSGPVKGMVQGHKKTLGLAHGSGRGIYEGDDSGPVKGMRQGHTLKGLPKHESNVAGLRAKHLLGKRGKKRGRSDHDRDDY